MSKRKIKASSFGVSFSMKIITHDDMVMDYLARVGMEDGCKCEYALTHNGFIYGYIDIYQEHKGVHFIYEIKTLAEIKSEKNTCGDTLRQLNKYEAALKIHLKDKGIGWESGINKVLVVPQESLTEGQSKFFCDNNITVEYIYAN